MTGTLKPETLSLILRFQREEANGALIYEHMAKRERNAKNSATLAGMAKQEREHAAIWGEYSGRTVGPNLVRVWWYMLLTRLLGFTFVVKLMENDEALTVKEYAALVDDIPEMRRIIGEEEAHERTLQAMLDEERLHYVGAMVLGLNDALVELTGTIAGLTFALANNRLVALAGIITGVSATLSMAASNYLAQRAEGEANAFKSSLYTGVAYLITVVCLVAPYLFFPAHMYVAALAAMLLAVVCIIFGFNYYVAVAKDQPFWPRFLEMACISLGVALISFCIGLLAKKFLHVDI